MHKCSICDETFAVFVLYSMHKETFHTQVTISLPGVKHPLTRAAKALLVARGEHRLGAHNFFGGAV